MRKEIIEIVGGAENIISAAHCATRLRLIVKDKELIDDKKIEAIDIVKGCFFTAGAVSDNSWNRYREQSIRRSNETGYFRHFKNEQAATAAQNGNALQRLIRIFADIFLFQLFR